MCASTPVPRIRWTNDVFSGSGAAAYPGPCFDVFQGRVHVLRDCSYRSQRTSDTFFIPLRKNRSLKTFHLSTQFVVQSTTKDYEAVNIKTQHAICRKGGFSSLWVGLPWSILYILYCYHSRPFRRAVRSMFVEQQVRSTPLETCAVIKREKISSTPARTCGGQYLDKIIDRVHLKARFMRWKFCD